MKKIILIEHYFQVRSLKPHLVHTLICHFNQWIFISNKQNRFKKRKCTKKKYQIVNIIKIHKKLIWVDSDFLNN